jgi:hypothetical protein
MKKFRQGDVFIFQVEEGSQDTKKFNDVPNFILAEGEVTGHKHNLMPLEGGSVAVKKVNDMQIFVEIKGKGAKVVHDEHETITLEPGLYQVKIQQEYDPATYRRYVAD